MGSKAKRLHAARREIILDTNSAALYAALKEAGDDAGESDLAFERHTLREQAAEEHDRKRAKIKHMLGALELPDGARCHRTREIRAQTRLPDPCLRCLLAGSASRMPLCWLR